MLLSMDLPDGKVRSDARSSSKSKRVGFQLGIDTPIRSYPALRMKLVRVWEYLGVARDAPAIRSVHRSHANMFSLPVVPKHGCTRRNTVPILRYVLSTSIITFRDTHTQKTSLEARRGAPAATVSASDGEHEDKNTNQRG